MVTLEAFQINGPARPRGNVAISGAKNAALPALAASLLTAETISLGNVPDVYDIRTFARLLRGMGAEVQLEAPRCSLTASNLNNPEAPYDLVRTMRASILVLCPLVARCGRARVSLPGGCAIGVRPVDMHLEGLELMGARIKVEHGYILAETDGLKPIDYTFRLKTVTGTENLMMAAALIDGETRLANCAEEPEVIFMAEMLRTMGAEVQGDGTDNIMIHGKSRLSGGSFSIIPDRIEAGTYLFLAAALPESEVTLTGIETDHLGAVFQKLSRIGADIETKDEGVRINGHRNLAAQHMDTAPYPGFPTDLQAQYMALMTQASGTSVIHESIFENRFQHVAELSRMGADIKLSGAQATVIGPSRLSGANVTASDLRASASLVIAGLAAEGTTVVRRIYHLDRGYSSMEQKLQALGCDVTRIKVDHA